VPDVDLPTPDSEELMSLLGSTSHQILYGFLYRRRSHPPTMNEMRAFAADILGEDQTHLDRRVRELRRFFDVELAKDGRESRYLLVGRSATSPDATGISLRRRAEVLRAGRCAMCGRTAAEHAVVLVVDHKIPQSWGGSNEPENLQALCEDCNAGKRDYFQTYDHAAEKIRVAVNYDEPQRRIGELLLAFDGGWVRTDLLAIVASAKEYQEDWQRRLRDLRFLGWEIASKRSYDEGARVWTYYKVVTPAPWPESIRKAITEEEARRRTAKRSRADFVNPPAATVQVDPSSLHEQHPALL